MQEILFHASKYTPGSFNGHVRIIELCTGGVQFRVRSNLSKGVLVSTDRTSMQDRPINGMAHDLLDRGPFVESLVRALVREKRDKKNRLIGHTSTGYVVGLTGAWGLGKSSIISMTAERLGELKKVVPVVYNPWLFSGRDDLLEGFFGELRQSLNRSMGDRSKDLRNQIDKYWGALSFAAKVGAAASDAVALGGAASAGIQNIDSLKPGQAPVLSALEERKALEKKLATSKVAPVILIDELDRLESSEVRAIAQLIKAIGEIEGISYLVAYEPRRVAEALGTGSGAAQLESGERYLEKIVQHPIPIRPLFFEDVERLLEQTLEDHGEQLPEPNEQQSSIFKKLKTQINTPREIKRLIGSYRIIAEAVRGEICPYDTLAYSWITSRSPSLQTQMADSLDRLVDDPTETELSDRVVRQMNKEPKPTITDILGPSASGCEVILTELFPVFGAERDSNEQQGLRISRRQNLIRLLYLGDPPSLVSRKEVEELWSIGDDVELRKRLLSLKQQKKLGVLLDRLDDFVEQLDPDQDSIFWPTLASTLTREIDWLSTPNVDRGLAEDIASMVLRIALRSGGDKSRAKAIFHDLVKADELSVAPYIFRKHLFHYGLTKHSTRERTDEYVFSKLETENLISSEISRYTAAIKSGRALRRLPNVEAIYSVGNMKKWDDETREQFTQQLDSVSAIATLAGLIVPPGYSTDKSSLDELFDTDLILDRINGFGSLEELELDPWIQASLKRLNFILLGKDTMYMDD